MNLRRNNVLFDGRYCRNCFRHRHPVQHTVRSTPASLHFPRIFPAHFPEFTARVAGFFGAYRSAVCPEDNAVAGFIHEKARRILEPGQRRLRDFEWMPFSISVIRKCYFPATQVQNIGRQTCRRLRAEQATQQEDRVDVFFSFSSPFLPIEPFCPNHRQGCFWHFRKKRLAWDGKPWNTPATIKREQIHGRADS